MTDANGIVTEYSYSDAGCVTRIVRRDGSDVLSSLDVASSKGTTYFNDMLGTTVGSKSGKTYSAATLSAFGEDLNHHSPTPTSNSHSFYTGKPQVEGLGYAFLMRNYRAGLAKWQTADPMGYPDGWNQLAYCGNGVTGAVDLWGCQARTIGDVEYIDLDIDMYFSLKALGGTSKDLELEGFVSEWLGKGRTHIELPGTRHSAVSGGVETTWAMFADYEKFAKWTVNFVAVEFVSENICSRLCAMANTGGKVSAAIGKVLSSFGIEAEVGAALGTIVGSLEEVTKDKVDIGLGRYKTCTDIYESVARQYEEIVSVSFIKE